MQTMQMDLSIFPGNECKKFYNPKDASYSTKTAKEVI